MHTQNLVLKILSGNANLTSIKGHNSVTNLRQITSNIPNLDLFNTNAYTKSDEIVSICSKDIEWERNADINQGPNSVTNLRKMTGNNPNLDLVIINVYTKFGNIISIYSQDIERKRKSDIIQGL